MNLEQLLETLEIPYRHPPTRRMTQGEPAGIFCRVRDEKIKKSQVFQEAGLQ
jgi:hypothetical protein